jgi:hypothetical protein
MCGGEGREEEAENGKRTVQRSCLRLAKHINTETNIFEGDISSFKGKLLGTLSRMANSRELNPSHKPLALLENWFNEET